MMTSEKIRVGVIGANAERGWASRSHLPALQVLPEFEIAAVCTTREESARQSADRFGAAEAYGDHREMLAQADVDVVAVSVKVPHHYHLTMDALEAGKHVYTEWPLAANIQEAREMTDLARAKGVRTMVGLQERLTPIYLRLKEVVAEGYAGEVLACSMSWYQSGVLEMAPAAWWRAGRAAGANVFTVGFGHLVDALCMALGEFTEVSAVVATTVRRWEDPASGRTVDVTAADNVLVAGQLEGGATMSIHVASVPAHASGYRAEIYGRDGTLMLDASETSSLGTLRLLGAKRDGPGLNEIEVPDRLTWAPEAAHLDAAFPVAQMWRRFGEVIRGGESEVPSFETGLNRHRVMDAIERASETGRKQLL
jgi:predicted dehydrogenase